jgi:non-heme chloroperoxidase
MLQSNVQLNLDTDLHKDLTNIRVPTLILHGVNDRVCLFDLSKVMHENIKGSHIVQIEKGGHGFYFEKRES